MKKLQHEKAIQRLKLNRETLRQLEKAELERADGGITSPSICMDTTAHCCVTL